MKRTFQSAPGLAAQGLYAPHGQLPGLAPDRRNARSSPEGPDVRVRLLEAALHLFGQRGYGETSIRDLAVAADANQAAVNYHFGGKENLRIEALRYGFAPTTEIAVKLQRIAETA